MIRTRDGFPDPATSVPPPPTRVPYPKSANLNDAALLGEPPVGLPSDLLQERPDIITLTGSFGTASPDLPGLFDSGTKAWLFVPQLAMPIFAAGRRSANLDVAEVRRDAAVIERAIQSAFRDVAAALSRRS